MKLFKKIIIVRKRKTSTAATTEANKIVNKYIARLKELRKKSI